jgi:serine/threonine protein kinase
MPKTIKFYKHVLKSLFGQLALAHRVGVSNFDLSDFNNILLDEKGDVVLIDWNGNMYVGEPLYDPDSAFSILPPEAWFETIPHNGKEHDVMISSTHALDVWEVGIVFAKMLFQPCQWANYHCFNKKYDELLDATIYATARGNNSTTMLYVNEEAGEVDLRTLVKKNKNYTLDSVTKTRSLPDFTPLLCNGRHKCDAASFPVFDKLTAVEQHQALDLLRNMMRLSPKDRPTFDVLLKHPFFNAS